MTRIDIENCSEINRGFFTEEQQKAYKTVIRAIDKAVKTGLSFHGEQFRLVAYKAEHDRSTISAPTGGCMNTETTNVLLPSMSASVLSDSGADDAMAFTKEGLEFYRNLK